jgi:TRAP-type C4-dicarboxylate transport system permease small subunit
MSVMKVAGRLVKLVELLLIYTAVLAAFLMMCLTSADAFSRYLLNSPILGAYEITEKYLMVATIFLGMSYAYRGGIFIRVTFMVDRLSGPLKILTNYIAYLVTLLFCAVTVVATAQQALRSMADHNTLSALDNVPVSPAYFIVPIGLFALTVLLALDLPRVRRGQAYLFATDAPTS